MSRNLGMYDNFFPVLMPVDVAATATMTKWVDMRGAHRVAFLAQFGVITDSADDTVTLKVECATISDTAVAEGTSVAFTYRLSSAVTANTLGAPTAATAAAGYAPLGSALTGRMVFVEVDPAVAQTTVDTGRYVRLSITPSAGSVCLVGVLAKVDSSYKMQTMTSVLGAT